jgi:hypothetical protein
LLRQASCRIENVIIKNAKLILHIRGRWRIRTKEIHADERWALTKIAVAESGEGRSGDAK